MLNLGLEGMMIVGAATGFAFAYSPIRRWSASSARLSCGVALVRSVRLPDIGLAANQVAAGLAMTIFGRGLANLIGAGFVGLKRSRASALRVPGLTDLAAGRQAACSARISSSISRSC